MLDAPAVALGMLQGTLHLFVKYFHKPIGPNGFGAGSGQIRRSEAGRKRTGYRLLDPVGFQAETSINRKDFGLNWNQALEAGGVLVGDKVEISIDAQGVKAQSSSKAA